MKKSFWSMLAIMMVTVLSFSFASCDKDKDKDDDNKNAKGTYTLSYEIEQGTLSNLELTIMQRSMNNAISGSEFKDMTLDEVYNNVSEMAKTMAPEMVQELPGKTFTVKLLIKNASGETVKTITIEVENGQIKQ
jgi:hypothetical protein